MEEELIKRVKFKDKKAFDLLIEPYYKKMRVSALSIVGNTADADDILQETLYDVYTKIDKLKETSRFAPWMYKILINKCFDWIRKSKHDIIPFDHKRLDTMTSCVIKEKTDFYALVGILPKDEKIIVIMKYLLDFKIHEIATNLNLSESAVKMRLVRAREKLKAQYYESKDNLSN